MSFFYVLKKYLNDSIFLWVFSIVMAVSCVAINHIEKNKLNDNHTVYSYIATSEYGFNRLISVNDSKNVVPVMKTDSSPDKLYATYALLMDGDNGRVLFQKNGNEKVPMASTTKIMTLIVTLENADLNDIVTVSSYAASMPEVKLNIKKDEQYRLKDLVYSLMLESHNDSAVAIAEYIGGSIEGFAQMMNKKAEELGAYDTHFVTPNGLDDDDHYTTAKDLALITKYALENPEFIKIIQTKNYTFHEQTKGRCFTLNNKNRFLDIYEGAIGVKTGFTGKAGYCFVGAANREDETYISVVLACGWPPNKNYKWNDTQKLMDYGFSNYEKVNIIEPGISFQSIRVENGIDIEKITPYVKDSVTLSLCENDVVTYDIEVPDYISAPVKKDQNVGTLTITINDDVYKVIPLYSRESCKEITYQYILKKIFLQFLVF